MEGNEGAVGLAVFLGSVRSHNLSIVRDTGTALRLDVNALKRCANQFGRLQDLLHKSVHELRDGATSLEMLGRKLPPRTGTG